MSPRRQGIVSFATVVIGFALGLASGSAMAQPAVDNATSSSGCPIFVRELTASVGKSSTTVRGSLMNAGPGTAKGVSFSAAIVSAGGGAMSDASARVGNLGPGKYGSFSLSWDNSDVARDKADIDFAGVRLKIENADCMASSDADAAAVAGYQRKNGDAQQRLALARYRGEGRVRDQLNDGPDSAENRRRQMAGTMAALDTEVEQLVRYLDETLPAEVTAAGLSASILTPRVR